MDEMKKITDAWCESCGEHADIVENGTMFCASCYLEKIEGGEEL